MPRAGQAEPYCTEAGVEAHVGERRRYGGRGGATYTWVGFRQVATDRWFYADPWPCLMPPKEQVRQVCRDIAGGSYAWQHEQREES